MNRLKKELTYISHLLRRNKSNVEVIIGEGNQTVKVCEIVNGKPFVSQIVTEDVIELILRYSLFRKEIKRYDKHTLREIE